MAGKKGRSGTFTKLAGIEHLAVNKYITIPVSDRRASHSFGAYNHGYKSGKKFKVVKCLEGLRIWRIK